MNVFFVIGTSTENWLQPWFWRNVSQPIQATTPVGMCAEYCQGVDNRKKE